MSYKKDFRDLDKGLIYQKDFERQEEMSYKTVVVTTYKERCLQKEQKGPRETTLVEIL